MNDHALRKAGLKVTGPRLKILELLAQQKNTHLSVEAIYQQLKVQGDDVGLATVYRVMAQFEAAGLVNRHQFENEYAVFEMADDAHHDHMVCTRCGLVKEFCDPEIEKRQQVIAKIMGFKVTDHVHTIYGECESCQR